MTLLTLDHVPAKTSWTLQRNQVVNEGPYANVQRIDRTGDRWRVTLQFPPFQGDDGHDVKAFLVELGEYDNWVAVPDDGYTLRGSGGGTPLVAGGSQTGKTLNIDGLPLSTTGVLLRGDRIGLTTGQVIIVAADVDSDGSGAAAVSLTTPLRASPTDNTHVEFTRPLIVCRLADPSTGWDSSPADLTGVVIDLIEDITSGVPAPSY